MFFFVKFVDFLAFGVSFGRFYVSSALGRVSRPSQKRNKEDTKGYGPYWGLFVRPIMFLAKLLQTPPFLCAKTRHQNWNRLRSSVLGPHGKLLNRGKCFLRFQSP